MSTPRPAGFSRWHGYGAGLVFVIALWLLSSANYEASGGDTPPAVRVAGGALVPWTPALEAEWRDVMACVGLKKEPSVALRIWRLPPDAPYFALTADRPTEAWDGLYITTTHTIVLRTFADSAQARTVLRHEFLHAALRSTHSKHEPVFHKYAATCNLGTVERGT